MAEVREQAFVAEAALNAAEKDGLAQAELTTLREHLNHQKKEIRTLDSTVQSSVPRSDLDELLSHITSLKGGMRMRGFLSGSYDDNEKKIALRVGAPPTAADGSELETRLSWYEESMTAGTRRP